MKESIFGAAMVAQRRSVPTPNPANSLAVRLSIRCLDEDKAGSGNKDRYWWSVPFVPEPEITNRTGPIVPVRFRIGLFFQGPIIVVSLII